MGRLGADWRPAPAQIDGAPERGGDRTGGLKHLSIRYRANVKVDGPECPFVHGISCLMSHRCAETVCIHLPMLQICERLSYEDASEAVMASSPDVESLDSSHFTDRAISPKPELCGKRSFEKQAGKEATGKAKQEVHNRADSGRRRADQEACRRKGKGYSCEVGC